MKFADPQNVSILNSRYIYEHNVNTKLAFALNTLHEDSMSVNGGSPKKKAPCEKKPSGIRHCNSIISRTHYWDKAEMKVILEAASELENSV